MIPIRPSQTPYLLALVALMSLDTLITAWGILNRSDFMEANQLFAQFTASPWLFIGVIIAAKCAAMVLFVLIVSWANANQDQTFGRATGDVVLMTGTTAMAVMLGVLGAVNVGMMLV